MSLEAVIAELSKHDCELDKSLVRKAVHFAMIYHAGQRRDSGEPYFMHPIEVASIVAELRFDCITIITALLHDTVEDTELTLDTISKHFGAEVATLVDGVTKLKKIKLKQEQVDQAENFRKLFLAMVNDIRVLIVKLADRLHNMRTISFKSEEKKRKISLETLEIYAPLAERVGFNKLKNELQDICFANLYPSTHEMIIKKLNDISLNRGKLINEISAQLSNLLLENGIEVEIHGREKEPYSIWKKMITDNLPFDSLSDIIGFRIMVKSQEDCYKALGTIHSAFKMIPGTFKDFISIPKPNGYQSLHTVITGPMQKKIEIQIRTPEMHEIAELGLAAHWSYKQQYQGKDIKNYRWIRELISVIENSHSHEEMLHNTKLSMYKSQIFCFTTTGDLITLPKKATCIDFAYALGSEFGHHCVGVKVNSKLAPLSEELKTGDMVEIITAPEARPQAAWEAFVCTGKAKAEIRKYLLKQEQEQDIKLGQSIVESVISLNQLDQPQDEVLNDLVDRTGCDNAENLYYKVGSGAVSIQELQQALQSKNDQQRSIFRILNFGFNKTKYSLKQHGITGLVPGVSARFATCCNPIPGDKIVGVIQDNKGMEIHYQNCNVLKQIDQVGILQLKWNSIEKADQYVCTIKIVFKHDVQILSLIANHITLYPIKLIKFSSRQLDNFFDELICDVDVPNADTINSFLQRLKTEQAIYSAYRVRS